jgi:hypothetical protein
MLRIGPAIVCLLVLCSCSQNTGPAIAPRSRGVADGGGSGVMAAHCTVSSSSRKLTGSNLIISAHDAELSHPSTEFQAGIYSPQANGASLIEILIGVDKVNSDGENQAKIFQSPDPSQFRLVVSNVAESDGVYSAVLEQAVLSDGSLVTLLPLDCKVP